MGKKKGGKKKTKGGGWGAKGWAAGGRGREIGKKVFREDKKNTPRRPRPRKKDFETFFRPEGFVFFFKPRRIGPKLRGGPNPPTKKFRRARQGFGVFVCF